MRCSETMMSWVSRFALVAMVGGVVGCGGSQKQAAAPAESPCVAMAAHMIAVSPESAFGEGDTAPVKAVVQKVMTESCQANAWAPAVIECINAATADGMQACSAQLTPAQQEALTKAMADEMGARQKQDEAVEPTDGAKSMDPCAGGE